MTTKQENYNKKFIHNYVDFILLNVYATENLGFYNGKAGFSLCLFEVAKFCNDETIEESVFDLFIRYLH